MNVKRQQSDEEPIALTKRLTRNWNPIYVQVLFSENALSVDSDQIQSQNKILDQLSESFLAMQAQMKNSSQEVELGKIIAHAMTENNVVTPWSFVVNG